MRRHALVTALLVLTALAGAAVLPACEEDKPMERPVLKRPKPRHSSANTEADNVQVVIPLKNQKWNAIEQHFRKYLGQKHTTPKDVFRSSILKFVPRPAVKETEEEKVETVELEQEERGPLQQYPLKEYRLLLIMSGTAVPKAVVVDPKSQAFVVQRDTRIGDKGGIVEAITQYDVVVKEPNAEDAVKLSIKPPYVDLASQTSGGPGDAGLAPDEFAASPPTAAPPVPLGASPQEGP